MGEIGDRHAGGVHVVGFAGRLHAKLLLLLQRFLRNDRLTAGEGAVSLSDHSADFDGGVANLRVLGTVGDLFGGFLLVADVLVRQVGEGERGDVGVLQTGRREEFVLRLPVEVAAQTAHLLCNGGKTMKWVSNVIPSAQNRA